MLCRHIKHLIDFTSAFAALILLSPVLGIEKFALDVWYVGHQPLWLDLKDTLDDLCQSV